MMKVTVTCRSCLRVLFLLQAVLYPPGGVIPTGEVSGPQGEEASRRLRHRRKVTPPASPGAAVTGGVSSVDVVHEVVRSTPADVSTSGRGPSIPGGSSALPRVALTESLGARGSRDQGEAQNEFQESCVARRRMC